MKFKQSVEQSKANVNAAIKSILPNVLLKDPINYQTIDNYIELHFTDADGLTDMSVDNIRAAIAQLHRDKQLRWDVRPRTQADIAQEARALNNKEADPLGLKARFAAIKNVADVQEAQQVEKALDATRSYAKSVRGQTHSETDSLRYYADKELKAQLAKYPKPTLAQAQEIDKAVRRTVNEMYK
jgi:hypothetical protein